MWSGPGRCGLGQLEVTAVEKNFQLQEENTITVHYGPDVGGLDLENQNFFLPTVNKTEFNLSQSEQLKL